MASEFLLAYRELVKLAGNDPSNLANRARSSTDLQKACDKVASAHFSLCLTERYSGEHHATNVPKYEIEAIRDYETRWRRAVAETDLILGGLSLPSVKMEAPHDPELQRIQDAAEEGRHWASNFDPLIEFARNQIDDEVFGFSEWTYEAVRAWDELRIRTGFDMADAMTRATLVPFVRVPSEISDGHGSAEAISLFKRLSDAQRAFIFGSDLACAALQRALLEDVLPSKAHGRESVPARIRSARLPWPLKVSDLDAINDLARHVLHADQKHEAQKVQRIELVKQLIRGLNTLQRLIGAAPIDRK